MSEKRISAVVPAGGYGQLDAGFSKLGATIGGLPMIVLVLRNLLNLDLFAEICVVVNKNFGPQIKTTLCEHLGDDYQRLKFATQYWRLGVAGAVSLTLDHLEQENDILVVFGDMPLWRPETIRNLMEEHRAAVAGKGAVMSMVTLQVPEGHPAHLYGRIMRDHTGKILNIIEPRKGQAVDTAGAVFVNPSLYVFDREFLESHLGMISPEIRDDRFGNEFHLPHLVALAEQHDLRVHEVHLADPDEALGVNTNGELAVARLAYDRRRNAG